MERSWATMNRLDTFTDGRWLSGVWNVCCLMLRTRHHVDRWPTLPSGKKFSGISRDFSWPPNSESKIFRFFFNPLRFQFSSHFALGWKLPWHFLKMADQIISSIELSLCYFLFEMKCQIIHGCSSALQLFNWSFHLHRTEGILLPEVLQRDVSRVGSSHPNDIGKIRQNGSGSMRDLGLLRGLLAGGAHLHGPQMFRQKQLLPRYPWRWDAPDAVLSERPFGVPRSRLRMRQKWGFWLLLILLFFIFSFSQGLNIFFIFIRNERFVGCAVGACDEINN